MIKEAQNDSTWAHKADDSQSQWNHIMHLAHSSHLTHRVWVNTHVAIDKAWNLCKTSKLFSPGCWKIQKVIIKCLCHTCKTIHVYVYMLLITSLYTFLINSQENECDGNFSARFIVCGSTGNLEYLGNKVHFRTIRKWSSRGRTLFPANFSQWMDKKRKQKQLFSAGKVPCCLQRDRFLWPSAKEMQKQQWKFSL